MSIFLGAPGLGFVLKSASSRVPCEGEIYPSYRVCHCSSIRWYWFTWYTYHGQTRVDGRLETWTWDYRHPDLTIYITSFVVKRCALSHTIRPLIIRLDTHFISDGGRWTWNWGIGNHPAIGIVGGQSITGDNVSTQSVCICSH